MNKLQQIRKKSLTTLIAISIIGVSVYLGFTPLFEKIEGGVAGAVVGASFGAIFVIVLTMYLLNKQTEIEQESKRGEKVFEEKMKIYWMVINDTQAMLADGEISEKDEMKKLPFVYIKLLAVGSNEVIKAYDVIYKEFRRIFNKTKSPIVKVKPTTEETLMGALRDFAIICRVDLGISDEGVTGSLFDDIEDSLSKNQPIDDPENPVVDGPIQIELTDGVYELKRHKKGHIRMTKDGILVTNTKKMLRQIDKEKNLNIEEKRWSQTQNAGRAIIAKLKERNE